MAEIGVIGAGVAGLYAALMLRSHGHTVTVLEAKPKPGGLSTTARHGDVLTERSGPRTVVHQTVNLDPGLYVNAGPGRIPHHHRRVLRLCSELGVDLEPYIMSSDANWYVDARSGQRFRRRRIEHDARGWIAELAYAADDPTRLRELVRAFGDLDPDGRYVGTSRAGEGDPIPLEQLTALRFWQHRFWQPASYLWQDVMLQPAGGMDNVWRPMYERLAAAGVIHLNATVGSITTNRNGAEVRYSDRGSAASRRFDWVLCSIPFPLLDRETLIGFEPDYRRAVGVPGFAAACKVGWQSETRWWQSDSEQIYGGISYTNDVIQQFWYPSIRYDPIHWETDPATLTGAYAAYEAGWRLGRLPIADRIHRARRGGALIHPEVADETLLPGEKALTVAWHKVPYQAGGWCHWDPQDPAHQTAYRTLARPAGRFLAIGDQASSLPGWQEGCLESVERALSYIDGADTDPERAIPEVPDSRQLTVADQPGSDDVVDEEGGPQ